jgi:phosphoenolpyruvate-protein phosphotransferase (PTS system enzyme I)
MVSEKTKNRRYQGTGASPGIVIGEARVADRTKVVVVERSVSFDEIAGEIERFHAALLRAKEDLLALKDQISRTQGTEHLYVIDTHLMILDDTMLTTETVNLIEQEMINAEAALNRTLKKFKVFFEGIEDEYLRERGSDVETVVERVLRNMLGKRHDLLCEAEGRVVIVAHDLSPADILQFDKDKVIGFVTDLGGKTSHTAIVSRSLEIPAVVGLEKITGEVADGDSIIVDGAKGLVIVNPDEETFRDYLQHKQYYEYREKELLKLRDLPAETVDGQRMLLKGNVEFIEEVPSIKKHGGEGIGLYRTEMLFLGRSTIPDEEEQFRTYVEIARQMAPFPVTIRTLDVGGDKFVPELNLDDELNPALGLRAIRLSLRCPELFKTQLRAILRASFFGKVRVFFPMISGVGELRSAKAFLEEAREELRAASIPFDEDMEIGIMIETPSAVIIADLLAIEVDFFSVGTNDLIQYSLAIDRTNEHLSDLYEPLHPAVLRSLKIVADAAHGAGIYVSICGEMAGEPNYLPILLGLGFDELSMNAVSIPKVKKILRRCSRTEAEEMVRQALTFATATEVEDYLQGQIVTKFSDSID